MLSAHPAGLRTGIIAASAGFGVLAATALLDQVATRVVSVHMVQHLLVTMLAAPLIAAGRPGIWLRRRLPVAVRRRWMSAAVGTATRRFVALVTHPVTASALLFGTFVLWHLPQTYVATIDSGWLRLLAFASFLLAGVNFWAAVWDRTRIRRFGYTPAIATVLAAAAIGGLPGAVMTFAPQSLYALGSDPFPICGLTVLEDQHLAGLIMWIPMDAIFIAVAAWLFVAWFRDAERTMVRHETQRLADRRGTRLMANIALLGGLGSGLAGCNEAAFPEAVNLDGNSRNGATLIAQFGCGKCHVIPGIRRCGRRRRSAVDGRRPAHFYRRLIEQFPGQHDGLASGPPSHRTGKRDAPNGYLRAAGTGYISIPVYFALKRLLKSQSVARG